MGLRAASKAHSHLEAPRACAGQSGPVPCPSGPSPQPSHCPLGWGPMAAEPQVSPPGLPGSFADPWTGSSASYCPAGLFLPEPGMPVASRQQWWSTLISIFTLCFVSLSLLKTHYYPQGACHSAKCLLCSQGNMKINCFILYLLRIFSSIQGLPLGHWPSLPLGTPPA